LRPSLLGQLRILSRPKNAENKVRQKSKDKTKGNTQTQSHRHIYILTQRQRHIQTGRQKYKQLYT